MLDNPLRSPVAASGKGSNRRLEFKLSIGFVHPGGFMLGVVHGPNDGARISPLGLCELREYPPAGPHDPSRGRSPPDTPLVLACGDSSVRGAMFIAEAVFYWYKLRKERHGDERLETPV